MMDTDKRNEKMAQVLCGCGSGGRICWQRAVVSAVVWCGQHWEGMGGRLQSALHCREQDPGTVLHCTNTS